MKKENVNEHLIHILEKTTPYQRLVWLGKTLEFWKKLNRRKQLSLKKRIRECPEVQYKLNKNRLTGGFLIE